MPTDRFPAAAALAPTLALAALALAVGACATARPDAAAASGATPCATPHVAVRNDTRAAVDVYAERDGRRRIVGTVPPGRTELPVEAGDTRFVAFPANADATQPGYANPVTFTVVCRGASDGAR